MTLVDDNYSQFFTDLIQTGSDNVIVPSNDNFSVKETPVKVAKEKKAKPKATKCINSGVTV